MDESKDDAARQSDTECHSYRYLPTSRGHQQCGLGLDGPKNSNKRAIKQREQRRRSRRARLDARRRKSPLAETLGRLIYNEKHRLAPKPNKMFAAGLFATIGKAA